jgi:hypothetical protein
VADLRKRCPGCGRQFRPGKGTLRLYCETCRPPRGGSVDPVVVQLGSARSAGVLGLVEVTRERLAVHGRDGTPDGVLVLALASAIDAGGHSGASLAALARESRASLTVAMEGVAADADVIDGIFGRPR